MARWANTKSEAIPLLAASIAAIAGFNSSAYSLYNDASSSATGLSAPNFSITSFMAFSRYS